MAEDQGNKEEEKFEFTSKGEALYISLDQAVLKARRLAREGEQHYLQRLRWDEIIWIESNSETREDSYRVVLKFQRPARRTSEEQTGEEEFLFDLMGEVLDRQVLVWPVVGGDASVLTSGPAPPREPTKREPTKRQPAKREPGRVTGIEYTCEDCGHVFPSGVIRLGPKYCGGPPGARDCAGARRKKGMGAQQADPSGTSLRDLAGNLSLDAVLDLCRQRSTEIYIGCSGGGAALRQAPVEELRAMRTWRWHSPLADQRVADPQNWIPGAWFLAIVESKLHTSNPTLR